MALNLKVTKILFDGYVDNEKDISYSKSDTHQWDRDGGDISLTILM